MNIFGTNFKDAFIQLGEGILNIFESLKEIFLGLVTLDFARVGEGILQNLLGVAQVIIAPLKIVFEILTAFFKSLFSGFGQSFSILINGFVSSVRSFINLFVKGLNGLISLLNKVPGVNIGAIREFQPQGLGGRVNNTAININIEGSADAKTVDLAINRFRSLLNRKGAF